MRRFLAFAGVSLAALCLTAMPAAAIPVDPQGLIRPELLGQALASLKAHGDTADQTHLVIVDYARRSSEKRAYLVNLETGLVEDMFRAAHGSGSDRDHDGYLDQFSDVPGSSASPEGAYLLAEEYVGKHGRSLRLDGLDPTNANARARAIVIHAADYAEPSFLQKWGKLGRSNGCIVFSQTDLATFLKDVPRGTLVFVGR
ncbi:murein L,D-transpeptidase catalytic domain-containing protein [Hyphomonas sp.]|uniref:murein L,D-transpeptidase catalytic domain-containing protein n=1 Tax=Hyphomonas sp. TaxID=87 RepID=UPI003527BA2B